MTTFEARLARRIQEQMEARREEADRCKFNQKVGEIIACGFLLATVVCGSGIETAVSIPFQVVLTLLMLSCCCTAYLVAMGWKAAAEELEDKDIWER